MDRSYEPSPFPSFGGMVSSCMLYMTLCTRVVSFTFSLVIKLKDELKGCDLSEDARG